jgi:hypothetical protein
MMRFVLIQFLALSLLLAGCEGVFVVGFVSNPGGAVRVSGTVSIVQLGFVNDGSGASVTITAGTLINGGTGFTVNFCGDQRGRFPMNNLVRADFNKGVFCSSLITVAVIT